MNAAKPATLRMTLLDGSALSIVDALRRAGFDVSWGADDRGACTDLMVSVGRPRAVAAETPSSAPARERTSPSAVPSPPESDVVANEQRGRHAETAERTLADKLDSVARLAEGVAHEINNVLSVVSVCTDEVSDRFEQADPSGECLVQIRHAIDRGSRLTRDLLAFSRRDIEDARAVSIDELVAAAKPMLSRLLGEDVTLTTELNDRGCRVRVDPGQWSSVLANLATNARAAMPEGGSMTFATRAVFVDPASRGRDKPRGRYLEIAVSDTGAGIPDDVKPRVFDPFYTTKGLGRGAGLGLSIVHGIVERTGGWIELASDLGRGTTLRIYVPTVTEAEPAGLLEPPPPEAPAPPEMTVLVVEDEHGLRRIAARALSRRGYRVLQAPSAEEALAVAGEAGAVDALVTDIVLPGMNGRRFATVLRERYPGVAVLYTSGHTNDDELRRGVSRAELAFLQKPYTTSELLERVAAVLERARRDRSLRAL